MQDFDYIVNAARELVDLCQTRDPFKIAEEIGITVNFYDLGSLKGMYCIIKRNRMMAINSELDEYMQRLVCAHELGHDILHRAIVRDALVREFELYHTKNTTELEANLFCAELLISDGDITELIERDYDLRQIAAALCVDENLAAIKTEILRRRGYHIRRAEFRSDFLKK